MRYLLVLFMASPCLAINCSVSDSLLRIRPGAEWSLGGEVYDGLIWLDRSQPKPSKTEVAQGIVDCQAARNQEVALRDQAVIDSKNKTLTTDQRVDALIKAVGL